MPVANVSNVWLQANHSVSFAVSMPKRMLVRSTVYGMLAFEQECSKFTIVSGIEELHMPVVGWRNNSKLIFVSRAFCGE